MHILIFGGTLFTGPNMVRVLLEHGHEVTVFHRGVSNDPRVKGANEILGDLRHLKSFTDRLQDLKLDVVVNMQCHSVQLATEFIQVVRDITPRVVVISSIDVYLAYGRLWNSEPGPVQPVPLVETAPLRKTDRPQGPAYDKISVERIIMSEPELSGTILRYPCVYGPNDGHRLHEYIKRMDDKRPAILLDEGMAKWRWTRGYADNVGLASALAAMDERATGQIYNVGEADAFTEAKWVRMIGEAAGWQGEIIVVPKDHLPAHLGLPTDTRQHWVVDTSKIRHKLGYQESVDHEEALARTIAWERANPPEDLDLKKFDYAAEDRVLADLI